MCAPNSESSRIAELERRLSAIESTLGRPDVHIDPSKIYTAINIGHILQCGKSNVYDLLRTGALASVAVGSGKSGLRVLGADILAFISSRRTGGPRPVVSVKNLRGQFGESC